MDTIRAALGACGRGLVCVALLVASVLTSQPPATPPGQVGAGKEGASRPCPIPGCGSRVRPTASGGWQCDKNSRHRPEDPPPDQR